MMIQKKKKKKRMQKQKFQFLQAVLDLILFV